MKWNDTLIFALTVIAVSCGAYARGVPPVTLVASLTATSQTQTNFKTAVTPLLDKYCTDCHGGENPKNNLSLEFSGEQDVKRRLLEDSKLFEHMADRIRSGEMPPRKKVQPNDAEKEVLLTWV